MLGSKEESVTGSEVSDINNNLNTNKPSNNLINKDSQNRIQVLIRDDQSIKKDSIDSTNQDSSDLFKESIFYTLTQPGIAIESLVSEWYETYEESQTSALHQLYNFIFHCCGSEETVTTVIFYEQEVSDILDSLKAGFNSLKSNSYLLIDKKKNAKTLRKSIAEFWRKWILRTNSGNDVNTLLLIGIIKLSSNSDGLESVLDWLITMSSSSFRPFRHTSTFIVLDLLTTICEMAQTKHNQWTNLNRQLNKSKKGESLRKEIKQLEESKIEIEQVMDDLFNGVFVHRYRDSDPIIRSECISELSLWISKYPEIYLDPQYLRYIGWMLSDKTSLVRSESVKSLTRLYKIKTLHTGLNEFTQRFKKRLIEMSFGEKENSIRIQSVNLICLMAESALFDESDTRSILQLLFSEHLKIREMVAPLVIETWREESNESNESIIETNQGNDNIESNKSNNPEQNDKVKSIKSFALFMVSLLKEKHNNNQSTLNYNQDRSEETIKLEKWLLKHYNNLEYIHPFMGQYIVSTSMEALISYLTEFDDSIILTLGTLLSRDSNNNNNNQLDSDCECFLVFVFTFLMKSKQTTNEIEAIIPVFNDLLIKYGSDYEEQGRLKFACILNALQYIRMEELSNIRANQEIETLFKTLQTLFVKQTDDCILDEFGKTFSVLLNISNQNQINQINQLNPDEISIKESKKGGKNKKKTKETNKNQETNTIELNTISLHSHSESLSNSVYINELKVTLIDAIQESLSQLSIESLNSELNSFFCLINRLDALFHHIPTLPLLQNDTLFTLSNEIIEFGLGYLSSNHESNQENMIENVIVLNEIIDTGMHILVTDVLRHLLNLLNESNVNVNQLKESNENVNQLKQLNVNQININTDNQPIDTITTNPSMNDKRQSMEPLLLQEFNSKTERSIQIIGVLLSSKEIPGIQDGLRFSAFTCLADLLLMIRGDLSRLLTFQPNITLQVESKSCEIIELVFKQIIHSNNSNNPIHNHNHNDNNDVDNIDIDQVIEWNQRDLFIRKRVLHALADLGKLVVLGAFPIEIMANVNQFYGTNKVVTGICDYLNSHWKSTIQFESHENNINVMFMALQKSIELYLSNEIQLNATLLLSQEIVKMISSLYEKLTIQQSHSITDYLFKLLVIHLEKYMNTLLNTLQLNQPNSRDDTRDSSTKEQFKVGEYEMNLNEMNQVWKVWIPIVLFIHQSSSYEMSSRDDLITLLNDSLSPSDHIDWNPYHQLVSAITMGHVEPSKLSKLYKQSKATKGTKATKPFKPFKQSTKLVKSKLPVVQGKVRRSNRVSERVSYVSDKQDSSDENNQSNGSNDDDEDEHNSSDKSDINDTLKYLEIDKDATPKYLKRTKSVDDMDDTPKSNKLVKRAKSQSSEINVDSSPLMNRKRTRL